MPTLGTDALTGPARAAHGHGGLVTLTGAAGAGKTRTAEEATSHAPGFRTLWTWCPLETATRPFRPWSRLLRELTAEDAACGRVVGSGLRVKGAVRRCGRRAELFVRFLQTNTAPEGLFTEDVFLDLTLPQWRLQTSGRDALVALRRHSHPALGTVPRQ
ncbi:ATP-binding protein [Streptomyces sp. Ag109_G2-15]|uniref:ATP-binding protein n=1 Tax=Streptomyces sp. Ag109_G2-15 TaxID=1938850 RepID=UPI000CB85B80|nr:ATP-binding protein [Streptomyces sp. Ag109_G2-15]